MNPQKTALSHAHSTKDVLKFIICSLIGLIMFFVPVNLMGTSTILIDHIVTVLKKILGNGVNYYAFIIIIFGGLSPFFQKNWNKDNVTIVFSIFKIIGIISGFMFLFNIGPAFLFEPGMMPFLYDKLVVSLSLLIPVGAVFLSFLVGYGLMEFIGVLMQPIMKPIWKTPGRSAIDAVASFVGSYSLGLLITNKVFLQGKYTIKEAVIIATGFSTVSATFMIIVAKTLGLMELWNFYFWSTLIITFIVTAITVRIYPISKKSDAYITESNDPEVIVKNNRFKIAWDEALQVSHSSENILKNTFINLKDGIKMIGNILPTIMSIGLLGLLLAKFTPIFDILGYIFYPFTALLQLPEPMLIAKSLAISIAEMFLPTNIIIDAPLLSKYVVGVCSISSVLFFSASIPCILSTEIPISIKELVIIWIERTILSLILAAMVGIFLF
ncbi:YjiH family protein [Anaerovirgula multivorans]|nr:YjiH family protein [Anaerovirgula multivorans]